ncbi:MAG TPA: ribosomal protein S18-alanine N-acetyltransferase [Burkholderiaceae bacterium]|nr:ribosomal protein S18-alanine N-acetyltransferase [Burkholderiaceae bacterium]
MNALLHPPELRAAPMTLADLDAVMTIEHAAYAFPWTRGNFIDSLAAGYDMPTLRDAGGAIVAYSVAMDGVQEAHLLNLTVAPAWRQRGLALALLDALVARARRLGHARLWLEVRESNARARALYARYGFVEVGVRRAYYPAGGARREDARVLTLDLGLGGSA